MASNVERQRGTFVGILSQILELRGSAFKAEDCIQDAELIFDKLYEKFPLEEEDESTEEREEQGSHIQ